TAMMTIFFIQILDRRGAPLDTEICAGKFQGKKDYSGFGVTVKALTGKAKRRVSRLALPPAST
ncbi:MAG TPA: hypothetical protein VNR20_03075, partial [Terriglobales bacterium]|nr:hypothetical protein [Terriglobales bacterium]